MHGKRQTRLLWFSSAYPMALVNRIVTYVHFMDTEPPMR